MQITAIISGKSIASCKKTGEFLRLFMRIRLKKPLCPSRTCCCVDSVYCIVHTGKNRAEPEIIFTVTTMVTGWLGKMQ
jgi:hypothetical protein